MIPFDFDSNQFQVKSSSYISLDNDDVILHVQFADEEGYGAAINIKYVDGKMMCIIKWCMASLNPNLEDDLTRYFQKQTEQYWIFQKKENLLIIRYNQEKVIQLDYSLSDNVDCRERWAKEKSFMRFRQDTNPATWSYLQPNKLQPGSH